MPLEDVNGAGIEVEPRGLDKAGRANGSNAQDDNLVVVSSRTILV